MEDSEVVRIASTVRDSVEVGGATYDIRKLSWRSLEKAAVARTITQAAQMRAMGGEIFRAIGDSRPVEPKPKTIDERKEARYDSYDVEEVLVAGVERVNGQRTSRQWLNDEVDQATAKVVHRRILDLSLPPLEPEVAEAVEGKF